MPTRIEKDAVTGVETTGHEWDGIKELNNPLPRWWLLVFYASIAFAVVWWVLYPSWPWVHGYWHGLLGYNQRTDLDRRMAEAEKARGVWLSKIQAANVETIAKDPELRAFAIAGGAVAFKDNCAPCHGLGGAGQKGYPTLADDSWLWGGTLQDIVFTIRHGIRNGQDPQARDNAMPAFGATGILTSAQIGDVTQYVLSLTKRATDQAAAEKGAKLFEDNCVVCHGKGGVGNTQLGAPALNSAVWLYGGTPDAIAAQIYQPKLGVMPTWQGRLDDATIKMLAVYVHSLGGGQ